MDAGAGLTGTAGSGICRLSAHIFCQIIEKDTENPPRINSSADFVLYINIIQLFPQHPHHLECPHCSVQEP